jgi:mRNA interferase MazF
MRFDPGEVVLLVFPFAGQAGAEQRPALVLFDSGDDDVLVARVTAKRYVSDLDVVVENWSAAGLVAPSTVRLNKLATVEKLLVRKRLGRLQEADWLRVRAVLRQLFGD